MALGQLLKLYKSASTNINLVTCKLRTAEIVMANLTHIFFPFVESHTFSSQIGGT